MNHNYNPWKIKVLSSSSPVPDKRIFSFLSAQEKCLLPRVGELIVVRCVCVPSPTPPIPHCVLLWQYVWYSADASARDIKDGRPHHSLLPPVHGDVRRPVLPRPQRAVALAHSGARQVFPHLRRLCAPDSAAGEALWGQQQHRHQDQPPQQGRSWVFLQGCYSRWKFGGKALSYRRVYCVMFVKGLVLWIDLKSFGMCICLWPSLIVLRWPCALDRMLKSNYQLAS